MQNTQQTSVAEYVINMVWDFMNYVRGNMSTKDVFTPTLAVLYTFHKGYKIEILRDGIIEFLPYDDKLYSDLANSFPHEDVHLHDAACHLIRTLSEIDRDEFNACYVQILRELFDRVSSSAGHEAGDFYTPSTVTKLMAYIVNKENCSEVFDPFCGTASIVHEMAQFGTLPLFTGQELNRLTSIYARLNAEALYGHDECIMNVDSISRWDDYKYDAVVSCPPLNMRLSQNQIEESRHFDYQYTCRSFEDIILTRPFGINKAKLSITLLATGFCFRGNRDYELRQHLVESNLADTIIALPAGILYGTSIPSIILVCKSNRQTNDPVTFIHAEEYFFGDRRKRTLDYDRLVRMIEGDACGCVKVSIDEIRQYDYNLNPALYYKHDYDLKEGQRIVRLGDVISQVYGVSYDVNDHKSIVTPSGLSRDFITILLKNGKLTTSNDFRRPPSSCRLIEPTDAKFILSNSGVGDNRFGIDTDGKGFACGSDIKVFKVNEDLVTPEYLVYLLVHNDAISKGHMPLSGYMMLPVVIDSLEQQKELVNKEIQQYNQKINAEREADAKRLGVKQNISDLEHMLGATQLRIGKIITRMENATPASDNYQHLVKSLKDNVEYMNRVIHYNNARIDSDSFNIKEGNIAEFIKGYADAWNNYGGGYFELDVVCDLPEELSLKYDKTMLTVMLDAILNNAIRHGFHKRKNHTEHNMVKMYLSLTEFKDLPFVLLSIANNGDSMSEGFTIEDYVSRGRYTSSTGRSGLGGYHVYQIAKGHNGYLCLDSNKVWNMIVDVLLPIQSTEIKDMPAYDKECI